MTPLHLTAKSVHLKAPGVVRVLVEGEMRVDAAMLETAIVDGAGVALDGVYYPRALLLKLEGLLA